MHVQLGRTDIRHYAGSYCANDVRKVKRWLILLLLVCTVAYMEAQQMEVNDFTRLRRPLWNRSKVAINKQKAIIDLTTTEKGFTFMANGKEAAEATEGEGFITVKVPHKTRFLTINHEQFGQLTWRVPTKYLKRKKHYRATLVANDPTKAYKPQQQWVVIDIDPRDAIVRMDSTTTLVNNGLYTAYLPIGSHTWQIEAPFYEAQTDSFQLSDTARISFAVKLQPIYSYVTVNTPWEQGEIYIDGLYVDKGNGTSRRIEEGQHRLSVFQYSNCIYDGTFTIGRAEKQTITLTSSDFNPTGIKKPESGLPNTAPVLLQATTSQPRPQALHDATVQAPVTLKAPDEDTEIYVDREHVGKGEWSGKLVQGYHIINTLKDSIESPSTPLWIVDNSPQHIDLAVPQVSKAVLNIHSDVTGADIYINNVHIGNTPNIVTHLPAGKTYHIYLKKDGYKDAKVIIVPKGNEMTDVKIKMKQKK